jgi:uncharacterized phosphosugar-binding protein
LGTDELDASGFGRRAREHLAIIETANIGTLDVVADRMIEAVKRDRLIYTAGTGHSLALVLETFYRAGGLACIRPIYYPPLLPLSGALTSTRQENATGLAVRMLERLELDKGDLAFLFSHSAANAVPVELAAALHTAGVEVVVVASSVHVRAAGRHPTALDFADHLLDTQAPYGDAAYPAPGGTWMAPLSTLASVYLWSLLLVRLADRARLSGIRLPVWTSANVGGGQEGNRVLADAYARRIPEL